MMLPPGHMTYSVRTGLLLFNILLLSKADLGRVPPRFSILPEDSDIMPGGSINITCEAVGSPMPYVKWMLGSKDLTPKDDVPIGRNVLELTDVRKSANYTCVAMSPLGVIETEVQITVKSPPIFSRTPTNVIGVEGGLVSFVCQASGDPQPIISWRKQGKKITSKRYEVIDFQDGSGSVLRIQPLQTRRDEAVYECVAANSAGQISTSTNLTVLREDQLPQGFPSIDVGPQLKVVQRSRIATMLCAASGNPDPEITWFKDFLPFNISNNNSRIKLLQSGALQIDQSDETDQGKYECVATNSEGTRYSAPANLYVRDTFLLVFGSLSLLAHFVIHCFLLFRAQRRGRVPPRFSVLPEDSDIMPGGSINITCVAVGSPMPYVKWMLGSEDLTPKDNVPIGRNVLELTDVRKSAKYTCVAMSTLGVIETEVQITVK